MKWYKLLLVASSTLFWGCATIPDPIVQTPESVVKAPVEPSTNATGNTFNLNFDVVSSKNDTVIALLIKDKKERNCKNLSYFATPNLKLWPTDYKNSIWEKELSPRLGSKYSKDASFYTVILKRADITSIDQYEGVLAKTVKNRRCKFPKDFVVSRWKYGQKHALVEQINIGGKKW